MCHTDLREGLGFCLDIRKTLFRQPNTNQFHRVSISCRVSIFKKRRVSFLHILGQCCLEHGPCLCPFTPSDGVPANFSTNKGHTLRGTPSGHLMGHIHGHIKGHPSKYRGTCLLSLRLDEIAVASEQEAVNLFYVNSKTKVIVSSVYQCGSFRIVNPCALNPQRE